MPPRILLLGHTGKMGLALHHVFQAHGEIIGVNSATLDASQFESITRLVEEVRPDVIMNTIAFMGIDGCEQHPVQAQHLNTLLPRHLAMLAARNHCLLIHFSTDAVFNDFPMLPRDESACPSPINLYGLTKFGGDCFITSQGEKYYIFRLPVLFGPAIKPNQFVEKMLHMVDQGRDTLRISSDIISSPSYTRDLAAAVLRVWQEEKPWGVYHLCNAGVASLYDLMVEITHHLQLKVTLEPVSHRNFPSLGRKNTYTPMISSKIPPLRPWREAVADYCFYLKGSRS